MSANIDKICVIACQSVASQLHKAAKKAAITADFKSLPSKLHKNPAVLSAKLQQAIDATDPKEYSRIVLGYGVCGHATVGLKAGNLPLVIPRIQDCISMFLGSDKAYKAQFEKHPGTYYFLSGWFSGLDSFVSGLFPNRDENFSGNDKAVIDEFLASWQKNYSRAVFINTGSNDSEKTKKLAKEAAQKYHWQYEEILADTRLLEKLLIADKSDDEILVVEPGEQIQFDFTAD